MPLCWRSYFPTAKQLKPLPRPLSFLFFTSYTLGKVLLSPAASEEEHPIHSNSTGLKKKKNTKTAVDQQLLFCLREWF